MSSTFCSAAIIWTMPRKLKATLPPLPTNSGTIGARIARTRRAQGLTQKQLAQRIGIERTLVTDYEIGRLRLSGEMVLRFALALAVSTDFILGLADVHTVPEKPDLKLTRRLKEIEQLPVRQKKSLLLTIDAYLKANAQSLDGPASPAGRNGRRR